MLTRRRFIVYGVIGCVVLLEVVAAVVVYNAIVAARAGVGRINAGAVANFPPSSAPYPVGTPGATEFFIVNRGSGPVAFVPYETNDSNADQCPVRWLPELATFRDPCYGAAYTLDGRRCDGPAWRNLDQYAVAVVEGQVWVNTSQVMPGALSTPAPGGAAGPTCPGLPESQTN